MPIELDDVCFQKAGNIERACKATIDLASHIVSKNHLGIPGSSRDSFELLNNHGIISKEIRDKMISMTGFRNVAIHEYEKLNTSIVDSIATKDYNSLIQFCDELGMKIII